MSGYVSSLEQKRRIIQELEVETDDTASRPTSPTSDSSSASSPSPSPQRYFGRKPSLPFTRDSLKSPLAPPPSAPPPPPPEIQQDASDSPPTFTPDEPLTSRELEEPPIYAEAARDDASDQSPIVPPLHIKRDSSSLDSTPSPSPKLPKKLTADRDSSNGNIYVTPTKKKYMAPQPPSVALPPPPSKDEIVAANAPSPRVDDAHDPSLDIERPRQDVAPDRNTMRSDNGTMNFNGSRNSTMDRQSYYDREFQFETISQASSEASLASRPNQLRFKRVTFKDFSQRGFLVPTWYVGYLQMTVGIATAILALTELLVPTASDTEYVTEWFTFEKFNIYGLSLVPSLTLTVAGCYLVRAQTKNDLHVVNYSAGYAAASILFHIAAFATRMNFLWKGIIMPSTIGFHMYITSLCIIILTLFGFWVSALGFGVFVLYIYNHTQRVDSVENLHKDSGPVPVLLDRYMGITH